MKKKLLTGFLWRALFFASNFVFNIAFARKFGAEQSGAIYAVINSLSLFLLIASLNIETGLGYYAAANRNRSFKKLIVWGIISVLVTVALLFPFLLVDTTRNTFQLAYWPAWFSLVYVAGNVLVSILQVLFFARGNYLVPNAVLTAFTFLMAAVFAIPNRFLLLSEHQWLTVFFLYQIVPGLFLLVVFLSIDKKQNRSVNYNSVTLAPVIRYSLIALAGNVLFFLLYRVDYWFVQHYTSEKDLGNYVQVSKFGQLLLLLPNIFSTVTMPRITDGSISTFKKPAAIAFLTIIFVSIVSVIGLLLFGQNVFTWLLGKDFSEMYWPALLKIPAIMFLSLQFVLGTWFSGKNRVQYNLYCTAIGVVFIVLLDFLLIPAYGISGASMSSLVAYFIVFVSAGYIYHRKTTQNFLEIFEEAVSFVRRMPTEIKEILQGLRK